MIKFPSFFAISVFCSIQISLGEIVNVELSGPLGWRFDPDEDLNTPQIIRRHGYPAESHIVETEDGYLLTVHRIPGSRDGNRGGQPILLQHGLLSSSADWVDEGNASLAFLLADDGYDVWLGNARGNHYSIGHTKLSTDSKEFWDFSWHEMGVYDLPAVIRFISKTTGKGGDILYVGHSMGTTMFFVFSSLKPEIAKLVKFMVALAPVAYMKHVRSPIRYLTPFVNEEQDIMPIVLPHIPAGSSTKAVLHYGQEIKNNGNFQEYDYGMEGNLAHYGTETPPFYNLTHIKVPIYLMYAANDYMTGPIDVVRLSKQLKNLVGMYLIPLKSFNHIDFLVGKRAPEAVYKPLTKILGNFSSSFNEDISVKLV